MVRQRSLVRRDVARITTERGEHGERPLSMNFSDWPGYIRLPVIATASADGPFRSLRGPPTDRSRPYAIRAFVAVDPAPGSTRRAGHAWWALATDWSAVRGQAVGPRRSRKAPARWRRRVSTRSRPTQSRPWPRTRTRSGCCVEPSGGGFMLEGRAFDTGDGLARRGDPQVGASHARPRPRPVPALAGRVPARGRGRRVEGGGGVSLLVQGGSSSAGQPARRASPRGHGLPADPGLPQGRRLRPRGPSVPYSYFPVESLEAGTAQVRDHPGPGRPADEPVSPARTGGRAGDQADGRRRHACDCLLIRGTAGPPPATADRPADPGPTARADRGRHHRPRRADRPLGRRSPTAW